MKINKQMIIGLIIISVVLLYGGSKKEISVGEYYWSLNSNSCKMYSSFDGVGWSSVSASQYTTQVTCLAANSGGSTSCTSPTSTEGKFYCSGGVVKQCTQGSWQNIIDCPSTSQCISTVSSNSDNVCKISSTCDRDNIYKQSCLGTKLYDDCDSLIIDCASSGDTCGYEGGFYHCIEGGKTCVQAGGTCKSSPFEDLNNCEQVSGTCTSGYCSKGSCTSPTSCSSPSANIGQYYCINNIVKQCRVDGVWGEIVECPSTNQCISTVNSNSDNVCKLPPTTYKYTCVNGHVSSTTDISLTAFNCPSDKCSSSYISGAIKKSKEDLIINICAQACSGVTDKCDGTTLMHCVDGVWANPEHKVGKCGYTNDTTCNTLCGAYGSWTNTTNSCGTRTRDCPTGSDCVKIEPKSCVASKTCTECLSFVQECTGDPAKPCKISGMVIMILIFLGVLMALSMMGKMGGKR